jgi:hypothetical protein
MEQFKAYLEYSVRTLIVYLGIAALLLGAGILVWQTYLYLQYAVWKPLPLMSIMPESIRYWVQYPSSWIGLSRILREVFEFVPASLVSVLVGIMLVGRRKKLDALKSKYSTEKEEVEIDI